MANELALSVEAAARELSLSRWATYEAIKRRELPAVRVGRRILVPRAALEHWLQQNSMTAQPPVERGQ